MWHKRHEIQRWDDGKSRILSFSSVYESSIFWFLPTPRIACHAISLFLNHHLHHKFLFFICSLSRVSLDVFSFQSWHVIHPSRQSLLIASLRAVGFLNCTDQVSKIHLTENGQSLMQFLSITEEDWILLIEEVQYSLWIVRHKLKAYISHDLFLFHFQDVYHFRDENCLGIIIFDACLLMVYHIDDNERNTENTPRFCYNSFYSMRGWSFIPWVVWVNYFILQTFFVFFIVIISFCSFLRDI